MAPPGAGPGAPPEAMTARSSRNGSRSRRWDLFREADHLLVEEFRLCDDASVEREQERELRQWAISLSEAADPERRAMGRAILMLLEEVDSLHAELQRRPAAPEPHQMLPAVDGSATIEVDADATPVEDTRVLGFRDRLRAATHRGRD